MQLSWEVPNKIFQLGCISKRGKFKEKQKSYNKGKYILTIYGGFVHSRAIEYKIKNTKSSINFLLVVEYISFDFSELREKFQYGRNFSLPESNKNKFSTSKSKNFDLRYFIVFSIPIIYISRLLSFTM